MTAIYYAWMATPFGQFDNRCWQPRMRLNQRKKSSIVQPAGLQGGTQLVVLGGITGRDASGYGDALENVELQVELGGSVLVIDPQGPSHFRQGRQQAAIGGRQLPPIHGGRRAD